MDKKYIDRRLEQLEAELERAKRLEAAAASATTQGYADQAERWSVLAKDIEDDVWRAVASLCG